MVAEPTRAFVVTLASREEDGVLIYEVADNGLGMDYEISKKVFSKFFTTKGSDRGTGLGPPDHKADDPSARGPDLLHLHGGRGIGVPNRASTGVLADSRTSFRRLRPREPAPYR